MGNRQFITARQGICCLLYTSSRTGDYHLEAGEARSFSFEIGTCILDFEMMMNTVYYFRSQRDVGEWEAQDKNVMFQDQRPERIDASGGWFDATGDYGIHLSHLTHSKYYTPQQTSLSAYVFYKANDITKRWYKDVYKRQGVNRETTLWRTERVRPPLYWDRHYDPHPGNGGNRRLCKFRFRCH